MIESNAAVLPPDSPKCKTEKCTAKARWRGLCNSCYGQARHLIDKGETNWEELAQMGMCDGPTGKPFTALFRAKKLQRVLDRMSEGDPLPIKGVNDELPKL